MKVSVLIFGAQRPQQLVPFGGAVKWGGAHRLWFGQGTSFDSFQLASWLSGLGMSVPIGLGVSLMPLRTPQQAAIEARSIAAITGHSVVAGFGPGSVALQQGLLGKKYDSPLTAMREFIDSLRVLLDGPELELVDPSIERSYYQLAGPLPEIPAASVEIGLGILRPAMAELVGRSADCGITWLLPAAHLRDRIVPTVQAAAAGRSAEPRVVAIVPAAVSGPNRDPNKIALSALGGHLQEPQYQAALRTAGVPITGEVEEDARACVEHGVLAYGTPEAISDQLQDYADAGVDEVVLNVSGVAQTLGSNAAASDLRMMLETITSASKGVASHACDQRHHEDLWG